MKYVKNYSTIAQATADTTAVSPLLAFCSENAQVFNLMGGGIDTPLEISAQNGIISVQEKPVGPTTSTFTIGGADGTEYTFVPGMTWREWVESEYNTAGYFVESGYVHRSNLSNSVMNGDYSLVHDSDEIDSSDSYKLEHE